MKWAAANPRRKRFQNLSINRMIPNMLTLLALSAGLTAIRFALDGRWEYATLAIVAAGILDALDGRIARLLKGASKFGAELDSLSYFVCFWVPAPAMSSPAAVWNAAARKGGGGMTAAVAGTGASARNRRKG